MSAAAAHLPRGAALLGGVVAIALALPVVTLLGRAVGSTAILDALASSRVLQALALSLATTVVSLAITVALGLPLALVLARRRFRGSALVEAVVDLPIVLPPSVAGLALLLLLGRRGPFGEPLDALGISIPFTTAAVILAQTFVAAPFFIRSARAGFAAVDRDLEDAARVDGATERQLLLAVTIPMAAASLGAGMVLSWARALGEFGATILFAGNVLGRTQTLPLLVYAEFGAGDLEASIAAGALLVLAALGVLVVVRGLGGGRAPDARGVGS